MRFSEQFKIKTLTLASGGLTLLIIVAALIDLSIERIERRYIETRPFSHYYEYHSISPTNQPFEVGQTFSFVSQITSKKGGIPIIFTDIVYCDYTDDGAPYRKEITTSVVSEDNLTDLYPWPFEESGVSYSASQPSDCVLVSHIHIRLKYGIEKTETIKTPFIVR